MYISLSLSPFSFTRRSHTQKQTTQVTCMDGYTSERPLCYNNSWSEVGVCLPDPCDSDPIIDNLNNTASECEGTLSNATCAFECASGYTTFGTAMCYAGDWTLDEAVCEADCPATPNFANVDHSATSCPERSSRESCAFLCEDGYFATGPAYCEDGVWTNHSTMLPCEESPCNDPPNIQEFDELSST